MKTDKRNKKKRRWWLIPLILVLVIGAAGAAGAISDAPSRQEVAALSFDDVDFCNLHDGTYVGSFKGTAGSLRDVTLEVAISGGEVSGIRILQGAVDETGTAQDLGGGMSVNDLLSDALQKESLQVDTISGATLTCNAHLKALEDALKQAQTEQP